MRISRRFKHVTFVCFVFISTNILLYLKSEQLFPSNAHISHMTTPLRSKLRTETDDVVMGLANPVMFMENTIEKYKLGEVFPKGLWPNNKGNITDENTLIKQLDFLNFMRKGSTESEQSRTWLSRMRPHPKDKIILVTSGVRMSPWEMKREKLIKEGCPITNCFLIEDSTYLPPGVQRPDAVIYKGALNALKRMSENRTKEEVWIVYQLESPLHASMAKFSPQQKPNWTATYRSMSTLQTPYEKFVPFPAGNRFEKDGDDGFDKDSFNKFTDAADGKKKLVAWFITNCRSQSERMQYAKELEKHINIDIYGICGPRQCPKTDSSCYKMLKQDYKFYLAFENSNCREYITEKMFSNAFANNVVPIVMGAHPDDYRKVAPPHSFIHVDDFDSPKALADYLYKVDRNDTLYNEYFRWKGSGAFINTKFWCRLCAMLHARDVDNNVHWYDNIHEWWAGDSCVKHSVSNGWASWKHNTPINMTNTYNITVTKRPK